MAAKKLSKTVIFKSIVEKNLVLENYSKKELAVMLSMCEASLYNKLRQRTFTMKELEKLFSILNFTSEEKLMVI